MSETKHTPGPWYFVTPQSHPEFFGDVDECSWGLVAGALPPDDVTYICGEDSYNEPQQPGEEDVNLILAAPDLLEACEAFVTAYKKSLQLEKTDVALSLAVAAIAKAKGESK